MLEMVRLTQCFIHECLIVGGSTFDAIELEIVEIGNQSGVKQMFTFAKDPTRIDSLRRKLGEALHTFHVSWRLHRHLKETFEFLYPAG